MQKKFDKLEDKYNNLYQENLSLQNQRNNELLQLYNKLNHNFLEKIFYLANYRKNLASYWRYTILSKILIGKKRTHYSMKRQL